MQDQLDVLIQIAQLGSEWRHSGLYITSVPFQNLSHAANLSRSLSYHLTGNWSGELDSLLEELRSSIVHINSTQVDLFMSEGFISWMSKVVSHLQQWAGIAGLGCSIILRGSLCLWCLMRMRNNQRRERAFFVQALAAIELGSSPQVWLGMLEK